MGTNTSSMGPRKVMESVIALAMRELEGRSGCQMERNSSKIGYHTRVDPDSCNSLELNSGSRQGRGVDRDITGNHTHQGRRDRVPYGIPRGILEFHGIPSGILQFHGIPYGFLQFHGIPYGFLQFHGGIP